MHLCVESSQFILLWTQASSIWGLCLSSVLENSHLLFLHILHFSNSLSVSVSVTPVGHLLLFHIVCFISFVFSVSLSHCCIVSYYLALPVNSLSFFVICLSVHCVYYFSD
uniref:Uncharacterized protein n=1 Tax=Macaca fascicularis TaxID=9541 RepID=Q9GMW7_MACFA|nr:hypothetical protein [Macaca fascicularis]